MRQYVTYSIRDNIAVTISETRTSPSSPAPVYVIHVFLIIILIVT